MTSPLEMYLHALDGFDAVVEQVTDWDVPTPCPDWTARQLLGHVIDAQQQVAGSLTGQPQPPTTDVVALAEIVGTDPPARWRQCLADTVAVLRGVDPDAAVSTPGWPGTASGVLSLAVIEPLVHTWDLGTATGRAVRLDPDVVAAVLPAVEAYGDRLAATGMYRPAVPTADDAAAQTRLLGALGRTDGA